MADMLAANAEVPVRAQPNRNATGSLNFAVDMSFLIRTLVGLVLLAGLALPAQAQEFPALTGRVVDAADIIPADVEAELTAKLEALETQSQRQLVVATIPSLDGYEISDYGYQLGREWALGDAERNDGTILLIAPNDRQVRIEVAYGLEPILTDGLSALIIQNAILPEFREGDMVAGIIAGTDAIVNQLTLPEAEAREIAAQAVPQIQAEGEQGFPFGAIVWGGFILFFFVLPMFRGGGGKRYRGRGAAGAIGEVILWSAVSSAMRGGGGGFSGGDGWGGGGDGFGGGGFSGGGGSFGGGGASGSW